MRLAPARHNTDSTNEGHNINSVLGI